MNESLECRLKTQHLAINAIVAKVKDRMFEAPQPGKWSIHDNITHLTKYQPVFLERINSILKNNLPVFERYTAEADPDFETWRKWGTEKLLSTLNSDRKILYDFLKNISADDMNRIGIHPRFGKMTVSDWTEFFLLHEAHHMFTMFQIANRS